MHCSVFVCFKWTICWASISIYCTNTCILILEFAFVSKYPAKNLLKTKSIVCNFYVCKQHSQIHASFLSLQHISLSKLNNEEMWQILFVWIGCELPKTFYRKSGNVEFMCCSKCSFCIETKLEKYMEFFLETYKDACTIYRLNVCICILVWTYTNSVVIWIWMLYCVWWRYSPFLFSFFPSFVRKQLILNCAEICWYNSSLQHILLRSLYVYVCV